MMAMVSLLVFIAAGHWYNDMFSKTSYFAFVPISVCFTSYGMMAYFISHQYMDLIGYFMLFYVFLTMNYEISVEGDLKDISVDQNCLMKRLGVTYEKGEGWEIIHHTWKSRAWGLINKYLSLFILGFIIYMQLAKGINEIGVIVVIALMMFMAVYDRKLYNTSIHDRIVKYSAIEEVVSIYAIMFLVLNIIEATILGILAFVYFAVMNKINWNTVVAPKV